MSSLNTRVLFAAVTSVFLLQHSAQAQSASAGLQINASVLTRATVLPEENEQSLRAFVSFGTNEFAFLLPEDIRAQFPQAGPVALTSKKHSFTILFRLLTSQSDTATNLVTKQELRTWAQARYTWLLAAEEFERPVAGHDGIGLQFKKNVQPNVMRVVRILWVPCDAGILEFICDCNPECEKAAQTDFNTVLISFVSNEHGKIKSTRRPLNATS